MHCKMGFLLYRHKHQSEVTVTLLEAAQLPLKIRCSLHSLKVKSEVNCYTNRRQSFSPFNLNVRWIRSNTFKSCSNLLFKPCRFLHQELREVIWEQWSQSAQINIHQTNRRAMHCAKGSINNCRHSNWAQMNLNTYLKNNMTSEVSIFRPSDIKGRYSLSVIWKQTVPLRRRPVISRELRICWKLKGWNFIISAQTGQYLASLCF